MEPIKMEPIKMRMRSKKMRSKKELLEKWDELTARIERAKEKHDEGNENNELLQILYNRRLAISWCLGATDLL